MIKEIKLNDAIIKEIETGTAKTINIITYLLTIEGVTTNKTDINKTALKDLIIDNMKPVKAEIDTWNNTMVFELEEIQQFEAVENIKVKSACNIVNYKINGNKTICLTKDNKVIITNDYNDNGVVDAGILASNNESMFYLLTSNYCDEAIKELFTIEDIKEYEQIKRIFNITINKSEDIEYINFVKEYVKRGINNA